MNHRLNPLFAKDYSGSPFRLFGPAHLIALCSIAACNASFVPIKLYAPQKVHEWIRYGLIIIWLGDEIVRHWWHVKTGQWSLQDSLPLHLCPFTGYLAALLLLTRHYYVYEFVYFMGIAAPGIALFTPDINRYGFPHYKFFLFFISHSLPVTAALYMTIVEGYQPSFGSIGHVAIEINGFMLGVGLINYLIGSNYIFLAHKPATMSLFDLLGPWPWYILSLECVGLATSLLLYLPFAF